MTIEHRLRAAEGSDFPAIAGPRSDRDQSPSVVTALRAVGRRVGLFLPRLGAGRHDLLQSRPLHFGEDKHPDGRHLRGPP